MGAVLLTIVGPLLVFGGLTALPRGRALLIALAATGALLALLWLAVALALPPLMTSDAVVAALVATAAWGAAALAQWARPRVEVRGRLRYPPLVLALLVVLALVFGPMLLGVPLPGGF